MSNGRDIPVVMVVFNRPEVVAQCFASVRVARPRTLLVATDAPRADHPEDVERCRAARAVTEAVDWPCEVLRDDPEANLGCDRRVESAYDWAFTQVDRAILLEDDVVPDRSFYGWAARMLERYEEDHEVVHVASRNDLARWDAAGRDHLVARRGSGLGWATWRRAWQRADRSLAWARDPDSSASLERNVEDPLTLQHLRLHLALAASGRLAAWDIKWILDNAVAGGLTVIPPVNLSANVGWGPTATRSKQVEDLRAELPVFEAPAPSGDGLRPPVDTTYDRWSMLAELMAVCRDPAMTRRLARSRAMLSDPRLDDGGELLHHLSPFLDPDTSLAVLAHLRAQGMAGPVLGRLDAELGLC